MVESWLGWAWVKRNCLPPCSGRPGMVLAPSRPTFSARFLSALPAWTLRGCGLEESEYMVSVGLLMTDGEQGGESLRKGDVAVELVRRNQLPLAPIPVLEHLGRRSAPEDAWVDEASKLDMGDMPTCAVDALEIPDCFGAGKMSAPCVRKQTRRRHTLMGRSHLGNRPGWKSAHLSSLKTTPRQQLTPFRRSKMPVNPQGRSSNGWTSMISTSSRSPGIAPSTSKGPER